VEFHFLSSRWEGEAPAEPVDSDGFGVWRLTRRFALPLHLALCLWGTDLYRLSTRKSLPSGDFKWICFPRLPRKGRGNAFEDRLSLA